MTTHAEQPFTDFEERFFLAEILKRSSLPPTALLALIRDARIEPAWNDIALPSGRSVSACRQAFQALFSRAPFHPHQQPPQLSAYEPSRGIKRPYSSMGDATNPLPRELQPRPPTFASVNGQPVQLAPPPPPLIMSPVEPQRKKRGRPTKAEFERRQAEAHERGEIWPKPRKAKPKPAADSPDGKKSAAAGSSSAAASTGSPARTESTTSSTGAPTAVMQPWSAASQPSPANPGPVQSQGYSPITDRRVVDQPIAPASSIEGPGGERIMDPPVHHRPTSSSQMSQVNPPAVLPRPYSQTPLSQGKMGHMGGSPQQAYQPRDAPLPPPAEQRTQH